MYTFKNTYPYSKNLSVLYAEDEASIRATTSDIFNEFFLKIVGAVDGIDGIEKYKKHKDETNQFFDLIITDINMPNKDGFEMILDILAINPEQPIIVISAYNDSYRLLKLIRLGIANFISKPIIPENLIEVFYKVSKTIHNEKMKNEFLLGQSKLASMGQMIDTIAHQWLGSVNILKMQTQMIEMDIDDNEIPRKEIKNLTKKQLIQIDHIIETLNEFRAFFKPNNKLTKSSVKDIVSSTLILLKDKLLLHTVTTDINIDENLFIHVIPNEFKHVIINIIINSIDEFKSKKIKNAYIKIDSYREKNNTIIDIADNAGGIPANIIDQIFKLNFTTKAASNGSGVGLHLVSLVLEKISAKISVENDTNGAKFKIIIKDNII